MTFPIEKHLGETFYIEFRDCWQLATLVDGEKAFSQPGISCGFVHLANPTDHSKCLGHVGVDRIYDILKENGDIE